MSWFVRRSLRERSSRSSSSNFQGERARRDALRTVQPGPGTAEGAGRSRLRGGGLASASSSGRTDDGDLLPERIREALQQARDFPEYQEVRVFRFLHMFSGERDVLGECLKEMATKEGLQVEVYSLDKKGEGDVDLAKDHPFLELKEEAEAHAFDAGHAGFPCNTFSRARWNMDFRGPPRSGHCNIYMDSLRTRLRSSRWPMLARSWHQGRWK